MSVFILFATLYFCILMVLLSRCLVLYIKFVIVANVTILSVHSITVTRFIRLHTRREMLDLVLSARAHLSMNINAQKSIGLPNRCDQVMSSWIQQFLHGLDPPAKSWKFTIGYLTSLSKLVHHI